jgi:hypothetical protein
MRNSQPSTIRYQTKKITTENKQIKTTNINILLNRVRQENINYKKKEIILLISIIGILSFISILVFGN